MFRKSIWKAIPLLIGVIAVTNTIFIQAQTRHGIWWYRHNEQFSITLINLTDHKLTASSNTVTSSDEKCYPYPFEHFGINVDAYQSAIWQTDVSLPWPSSVQYYSGKITFQLQDVDAIWSFDLNFKDQDAGSASCPGRGNWVYLTATDTTNPGWTPSWNDVSDDWSSLGSPYSYRGYATPLNDVGNLHNQMNLEGSEYAVTVYSSDNINITVIVQQTHEANQDPQTYQKWHLDWVDNDADCVPSS